MHPLPVKKRKIHVFAYESGEEKRKSEILRARLRWELDLFLEVRVHEKPAYNSLLRLCVRVRILHRHGNVCLCTCMRRS